METEENIRMRKDTKGEEDGHKYSEISCLCKNG